MKARGIATEAEPERPKVTPEDAVMGLSMIGLPAELMRRVMAAATKHGVSPAQVVGDALAEKLLKLESADVSGRRL